MNKLIFFLLLASSSCISAQKYVPFPTDDANWNILYIYEGFSNYYQSDTTLLQYSLRGDSIINGISYRKVYRNIGSLTEPILKCTGGLREDAKNIYYSGLTYPEDWESPFPSEVLLYDFTKNVGDTVWINKPSRNYNILAIDSIKIGVEYRKRYKINDDNNYNDNPGYIIEGIGNISNSSLFGDVTIKPICMCHLTWKFICFSQNGETIYLNPAFTDCNSTIMTGLKDIKANKQTVKIYPSPAKDYIQFQFDYPDKKYTTAEIMDYTGKHLLTVPVAGISEYTLNLSSYSPGIYFVLIRSAEESEVHKIIKI